MKKDLGDEASDVAERGQVAINTLCSKLKSYFKQKYRPKYA